MSQNVKSYFILVTADGDIFHEAPVCLTFEEAEYHVLGWEHDTSLKIIEVKPI